MPSYILGESDLGSLGSTSKVIKFHSSLHRGVDNTVLGSRLISEDPLIAG